MFELMCELPWRAEKFTKEEWIKQYIRARYGTDDESIRQAWQILANGIYNCPAGNNQQGPHESIFCGRPSLNNFQASSWSKNVQLLRSHYHNRSRTVDGERGRQISR